MRVISSDPTNESAATLAARNEVMRWYAVESFCRPFNLDGHDKTLTCFDAAIEQVMYIDRKPHKHNLLQTIARVNRV